MTDAIATLRSGLDRADAVLELPLDLGDAAHVFPPFGGQGMNLGIQDAVAAARRIASISRGADADQQAWVLVRPDGHIAARGTESAQAGPPVTALMGS